MSNFGFGQGTKIEAFVDVEKYLGGKIAVSMKYYEAGRKGAVNRAYLRREVADRLAMAQGYLPEGYSFLIYDAWRPYSVQRSLYDEFFCKLSDREENQSITVSELHRAAQTFVSYPHRDSDVGYVHSSGGAVDLTIVDAQGIEVDMGCQFDDFTDKAYTLSLEGSTDMSEAHKNRLLLLNVMQRAGFTNFESEWWHYDFGDAFWAKRSGKPLMYTSVYSIAELDIWESEEICTDGRKPVTV